MELPHSIRTVFADLVEKVDTAPPAGSVYVRPRGGTDYLYARVRIGMARSDRFLGKVGEAKAEASAKLYRSGAVQARHRRATVTVLKRSGLSGPEPLLGATLDALAQAGLFNRGAVVIGTAAYLMSEALVGARLPAATMMTEDLDVATAHLKLAADPPESLLSILQRAEPTFREIPQLDLRAPASRFTSDTGLRVDVVTPRRQRDDVDPLPLPQLAAGAAPLQYLAWLIADAAPTVALWGAGVPVRVPQPARYAVHKLIIAQKRLIGTQYKRGKDLQQAAAIMKALERTDPFALEDALDEARARGKRGWADPIDRSLAEIERLGL